MSAAPKLDSGAPQEAAPEPDRLERHLQLVPAPPVAPRPTPADDEARRVRESRWLTALLAVVTVALFGLWTAAMLGATDTAAWPFVLVAVLAGVIAFGFVVVRRTS